MHDVLLVVGDVNTRVGREGVPFAFHETKYRNGKKVIRVGTDKGLSTIQRLISKTEVHIMDPHLTKWR